MRYSEDTGEDEVYDELVFLRGAGEYYEFCWKVIWEDPAHKYEKAMEIAGESGFNMIRQFIYSGYEGQDHTWEYPFKLSPVNPGKYALHLYNEDYFTELNDLIDAADEAGITVLLTLFDFTEDIFNDSGVDIHPSAWNPDYNIYSYDPLHENYTFPAGYTSSAFGTQFFNIGTAGNLNFLGKAQRDFVLKVVRETRHHPNVFYEIANEPKLDSTAVSNWANIIAGWIKDGYGDCTGSVDSLVAMTEADENDPAAVPNWDPYNAANSAILSDPDIDIFSRHNCYHGAKTDVKFPAWMATPIPDAITYPIPFNDDYVNLWQEAKLIESDFVKTLTTPTPAYKAFLVDTDGAHRGGWNVDPKYRDSDLECQHWANVAFTMGANFNTKDTLGMEMDYSEQDSAPTPPSNRNYPGYADSYWNGVVPTSIPIPEDAPYSGCDDFWWEYDGFYDPSPPNTQLNFSGTDVHLGHSLVGRYFNPSTPTPAAYTPPAESIGFRPYIQWIAYNENPIRANDDVVYHINRGSINGFGRGSSLVDYTAVYNGAIDPLIAAPVNTPMPGNTAFYSTGNINNYAASFDPNGFESLWFLSYTGDNSVPGSLILSALWPLLEVRNNICDPTSIGTQSSASFVSELISENRSMFVYSTPPPSFLRLECYENPISQQDPENEEADAEIIGMGWGHSNLYSGYYSGFFDLILIVRYSNFDPEVEDKPIDGIYIYDPRHPESDYYIEFPVVPDGTSGSGIQCVRISAPTLNRNFSTAGMIFNIALADYNITTREWSHDDFVLWPCLHVIYTLPNKLYITAGVANMYPDGTRSNPFGSVADALAWCDKEINGTIDMENPMELVMLPGEHTVDSSNEIELPAFFNLTGEDGASIILSQYATYGNYVSLGHGSVLSDLTIECGVTCEHSRAYIDNCHFTQPDSLSTPTPTPTSTTTPVPGSGAAISVDGHHDLHVRNCLFEGHDLPVFADGLSVLYMTNCTMADCEGGLRITGESIAKISNCIFYDIANGTGTAVAIEADSDSYAYIENCAFYNNDDEYLESGNAELNLQTQTFVTSDPLFVDAVNGDYHLTQTSVRNTVSPGNTSPCVDAGAWNGHISGSTASDNAFDFDQNDIGYHYPSDHVYNFPRFKADDGVSTDYLTEVA
ncbi:right-handed parallel beta-helix repeat-containing protein, partial [bacterium]|nr:right-handed parallel beta-helix repeat-containing protein [candidate division CSSED10-310 bacterium]